MTPDENQPQPNTPLYASLPSVSPAGGDGGEGTSFLQPLTVALLECVTTAEVVQAVVERGRAVLRAEAGLAVLVSPDGMHLEVAASSGYTKEVMAAWGRFALADHLPLSDAVRQQTPLFFTGRAEMEAHYPEMFRSGRPIRSAKTSASVSLPLAARGRALGGLHFSFASERYAFTGADRAFLLELARQGAIALERALLLQELQNARRRQEYLSRASLLLAESLHYQTTLNAITRLAVPDLCDWAAVDMVDDTDENGPLLSLAVAHADPAEVAWVSQARKRYPIRLSQTQQPIVHAIKTGETVFLPEIPEAVLLAAAQDEEQLRLIRQLDLRSYLCVPLTVRGRTLGAVTFASTRASGRVFMPETVGLVEELARRAAVAVDNARLYEQAQRVQIGQEKLLADLREASLRQRRFLKEMLAGFTEGRLRLCFAQSELPQPLAAQSDPMELSGAALRLLRKKVEAVGEGLKLPKERLQEFITAVHESAINAVKYGGGGTARLHGDPVSGVIQVWVEDHGPGIAEELIHRAVERGYTTAGFGHGMFFMQSCVDRLYLFTGPGGTTVVLESNRAETEPQWLQPVSF